MSNHDGDKTCANAARRDDQRAVSSLKYRHGADTAGAAVPRAIGAAPQQGRRARGVVTKRASERRRFVDEHDRNAVADGISQLAMVAEQRLLGIPVLQFTLALRTHKNREQL